MRTIGMIVMVLFAGCTGITNPAGPEYPKNGKPGNGYEYCQMISASARTHAASLSGWGWSFTVVGAGTVAAGGLIPLTKEGELEFKHRFGSAAMLSGGALLLYIGQALLKRSDASSKLAGETAGVLGETDGEKKVVISSLDAGGKCSIALGAWESSRADATAIASKLLDAERKDSTNAKAQASEATAAIQDAEAKKKEADAAIAAAEQQVRESDAQVAAAQSERQELVKARESLTKQLEAFKEKQTGVRLLLNKCNPKCSNEDIQKAIDAFRPLQSP